MMRNRYHHRSFEETISKIISIRFLKLSLDHVTLIHVTLH